MFIISLTYKAPLEAIDRYLENHVSYLKAQYALGHFAASGRKVPRTGGVILSQIASREALDKVLEQDPFYLHDLADYEIIEFIPSMTSESFKDLLQK